jgi:hypothetical protein
VKSPNEYIDEYRRQLEKGDIQLAYRGLMEYIMNLRTCLANKYPDYIVSGSIYYGYMDMTYFSFTPVSLANKKLKIAIVFIHEKIRFEVWLAGANKQIQLKYWKIFQESGWGKYHISANPKVADSIVEGDLATHPDFNNLDALTSQIETGTLKFTEEIVAFLS